VPSLSLLVLSLLVAMLAAVAGALITVLGRVMRRRARTVMLAGGEPGRQRLPNNSTTTTSGTPSVSRMRVDGNEREDNEAKGSTVG
jgi:hypothetical protein